MATQYAVIGDIRSYIVCQGITEADADANTVYSIDETFVLDGGSLLHRLE